MHIHGAHNIQFAALVPTQFTQQSLAARKVAAEVRRRLTSLAPNESDAVAHVDAYTPDDRGRRQNPQPDEESFRSAFVSIDA